MEVTDGTINFTKLYVTTTMLELTFVPNSTYKTYSANEKWQLKYVKEENIVNCNERNFTKNTSLFADPMYL